MARTWGIDPVFIEFHDFQIRYYGLFWALGIAAGFLVLKQIYTKEGKSTKQLESLSIYVISGVIIGARLGHCLFYDPVYFITHPLEMILPISKDLVGNYSITGYAGLASHGGAIGIIVSILLYSYYKKQNLWDILDKLALIAPLTGFFIRLGNFFNSEIIGAPTSMPWSVIFIKVDDLPRHPAQLYEASVYLLLFFILYFSYFRIKKNYANGLMFGISILTIFLSRFIIENYKEVQESFELSMKENLSMNMGQLLSLPFIIIGAIIIINRIFKIKIR